MGFWVTWGFVVLALMAWFSTTKNALNKVLIGLILIPLMAGLGFSALIF